MFVADYAMPLSIRCDFDGDRTRAGAMWRSQAECAVSRPLAEYKGVLGWGWDSGLRGGQGLQQEMGRTAW